jgi:hypothetical protein
MSERDALSKVAGLETKAKAAQDEAAWLRRQAQERDAEVAAQHAVNAQLMAKKEEIEW